MKKLQPLNWKHSLKITCNSRAGAASFTQAAPNLIYFGQLQNSVSLNCYFQEDDNPLSPDKTPPGKRRSISRTGFMPPNGIFLSKTAA